MTVLDFVSPDRAAPFEGTAPAPRSPLDRALAGGGGPAGLRDLSHLGKAEVRGALEGLEAPEGGELVRVSGRRALVICPGEDAAAVREALAGEGRLVVDATGSLAGLALRGERLMRRLTDLDLDALPAAGKVAHVPAYVTRPDGDRFHLFFPQELGHFVVEVVIDAAAGLAGDP